MTKLLLCLAALAALCAVAHCTDPELVLVDVPTNWYRASDDCRNRDTEMFYPKNLEEHLYFVNRKIEDGVDVAWTAASNYMRLRYVWVNIGHEVKTDNWNKGYPHNDSDKACVAYTYAKDPTVPFSVWENRHCGHEHRYYCRKGNANTTVPDLKNE